MKTDEVQELKSEIKRIKSELDWTRRVADMYRNKLDRKYIEDGPRPPQRSNTLANVPEVTAVPEHVRGVIAGASMGDYDPETGIPEQLLGQRVGYQVVLVDVLAETVRPASGNGKTAEVFHSYAEAVSTIDSAWGHMFVASDRLYLAVQQITYNIVPISAQTTRREIS